MKSDPRAAFIEFCGLIQAPRRLTRALLTVHASRRTFCNLPAQMRRFRLLHPAGALVPLASTWDGFAVRATFAGVGHPDHRTAGGPAVAFRPGERERNRFPRKADKYEGSQKNVTAEVAMTRVTAGLALLVVAAYAPGSPAQEDDFAGPAPLDRPVPSDWSFAFGAGALALPSYAGASSTKISPRWLFRTVRRFPRLLRARGCGTPRWGCSPFSASTSTGRCSPSPVPRSCSAMQAAAPSPSAACS